eukprot:657636-Lingulodinium_polyedra.AAC.1
MDRHEPDFFIKMQTWAHPARAYHFRNKTILMVGTLPMSDPMGGAATARRNLEALRTNVEGQ